MSVLGNWIRDSRRRAGKEQMDIAQAVGVTQQTISKWENGDSIPKGRFIIPLANALGISGTELTERILQQHNGGHAQVEALELDVRVGQLEEEIAALRSEWAQVREAFRRLLGEN